MQRLPGGTAGAFVIVDGVMPFMIGPTDDRSAVAIVRLGGHAAGEETAWDCARREAFEESGMRILPVAPTVTFECLHQREADGAFILEPSLESDRREGAASPLIVGRPGNNLHVTTMFLATSEDAPTPRMEALALILLTRRDVLRVCAEGLTLGGFQAAGGTVVARRRLDARLPLRPLRQVRMLATIIDRYPGAVPRALFP